MRCQGGARERGRRAPRDRGPLALIVSPTFEALLDDRVAVDLPEGRPRVVSLSGLAHMKRLAGRSQDLADLEKLGISDESDLSPEAVSRRLAALAASYVPQTVAEHGRDEPPERDLSPETVRRRLDELRALCALADHLQRR